MLGCSVDDWRYWLLKSGARRFQPALLMTLLYLLVGSIMLGLGYWQLQRANEKIVMQAAADAAASQPPTDIAQLDFQSALAQYTRVRVTGEFEPQRQFLWDNRVAGGQAGFEAITPLRLADGQLILLNRGWVPVGASRQSLPDITLESAGKVSLTGVFTRPSIGFSAGDAVNLSSSEWPRLLQHFAFDEIEKALGEPVLPGLVQIVRDSGPETSAAGVTLYPDNWQPVASGPERHYGYAFQWFAMFAALTALYVILNLKKELRVKDHE